MAFSSDKGSRFEVWNPEFSVRVEPPPRRLCKDCRYFDQPYDGPTCRHPEVILVKLDPVLGKDERVLVSCQDARSSVDWCGPTGKRWEGK